MTESVPADSLPTNSTRKWVLAGLKWSLLILVLVFVIKRGDELWNQDRVVNVEIHYGWLVAAGVAYLVGWLPSVWFWRCLLREVGGDVSFIDTARAYYCGHLGKYIPGKATVLIIRSGLLKDRGSRPLAAGLTATYETLAIMGTGLAVAIALSPTILTAEQWNLVPVWLRWFQNHPAFIPVAVAIIVIALLPIIARLFTWVAVKATPKDLGDGESNTVDSINIDFRLLLLATAGFVMAWVCHGLSLGLTIRAVSSAPLNISDWPMWTASVSIATAVGFFALFAPGGVGVREGLLIESLRIQPTITPQQAIVVAIMLRAVWFVAEILAAGLLYYMAKPSTVSFNLKESID